MLQNINASSNGPGDFATAIRVIEFPSSEKEVQVNPDQGHNNTDKTHMKYVFKKLAHLNSQALQIYIIV